VTPFLGAKGVSPEPIFALLNDSLKGKKTGLAEDASKACQVALQSVFEAPKYFVIDEEVPRCTDLASVNREICRLVTVFASA
jgi:hypothetical protein